MTRRLTTNQLILGAAFYVTVFGNLAFFRNTLETFSAAPWGYVHTLSLGVVLFSVTGLLLALLCIGRSTRPVLTVVFLLTAVTAYFMDTYNVIIDRDMLANVAATDPGEVRDLLTWRLLGYLTLLGILPTLVVWRLTAPDERLRAALRTRARLIALMLLTAVAVVLASSAFYASFIREHKVLRYYTNPLTPIYSAFRFTRMQLRDNPPSLQRIGEDARIPSEDTHRELVVMAVGETARADRFSLNGYARETNPLLSREDVISFSRVSSCGTSTVVSVPCMFAREDRAGFDGERARRTENLLDVLSHAGVQVLWRDNNSDSKGVATRVAAENYRSPERNPVCDPECRDEGMLDGLQSYIDSHADGDILIVLHQMGSHGPAYHKRYPEAFRTFVPTCETSQLDTCSEAEIGNSYDNTILYTDHFLAMVIDLLRANDSRFETTMVYVSDHGESLGEAGLYLHGLPYLIAPDTQTHVPLIFWFGPNNSDVDVNAVRKVRDMPVTHDHLFDTLLGMFEVNSSVYDAEHDILLKARPAHPDTPATATAD